MNFKVRNVAFSILLFLFGLVHAQSVSLFYPSDIPAIGFAAGDLQMALEKQGNRVKIASLSELRDHPQEKIRIILGLSTDKAVQEGIKVAGIRIPQHTVPESYAIRLSHREDQLSIWAIGSDPIGIIVW